MYRNTCLPHARRAHTHNHVIVELDKHIRVKTAAEAKTYSRL